MTRVAMILPYAVLAILAVETDASAQTARSTLPKSHRHPNLATENEAIPEFRAIDTALAPTTVRGNMITDSAHRYEAFTVADTQLFVRDRKTGKVRELSGVPFPWRAFSNLTWVGDRTLMFDRWSSPHFAVHYAVDVARGTLVSALTFHDQEAR